MTEKNMHYGIQAKWYGFQKIGIYNGNTFELNNLDVLILKEQKCYSYHINTIAAHSEWIENGVETDSGEKRKEFHSVGYFEGKQRIIDTKLFNKDTGIYEGEPHDALVWPDTDTDEKWKKELVFQMEEVHVQVRIRFIARGPKVAFCGHSFTGLWDSSYYYFRELAKMGGWNARVAYSYWGGTGIAHYAGLVEGCEERAEQCEKLINSNEYYDYFVVAGNSNEAVETYSGEIGAKDYKQRPRMLQGAKILHDKIHGKAGKMILWAPHAYQYGYLQSMAPKPWRPGMPRDVYDKNGDDYILTMTTEEMARVNAEWYLKMTETLGKDTEVLPVCLGYWELRKQYGLYVNPYLSPEEGGDYGHQNNIGNYIAACLLYAKVFEESPEGLGIPVSYTFGMPGGKVTQEQAEIIQQVSWNVYNNWKKTE